MNKRGYLDRDYMQALRQARVATLRGDIAATERWLTSAERYLRIRVREQEYDNPDFVRRR
jgi:hypothetical protein